MTTLVRDVPGCWGCPLRESGNKPFVPDELVERAPLLLYFQNPGPEEEKEGRPLVGRTGQMMERNFFPLAGLARGEVSLANSVRCRWRNRNSLPGLEDKQMQAAVAHCTKAHHKVPEGTRAILAAGEYATYALTGVMKGFSDWRGYVLPYLPRPSPDKVMVSVYTPSLRETPVLVSYHIAFIFRIPQAQVAMKRDWTKLQKLAARTWPVPFPLVDVEPPPVWPKLSAFDTEFTRDTGRLVRYSLAAERKVWVVEASDVGSVPVVPGSSVVMHNAAVDIPHIVDILPIESIRIEDTMYSDSVLWSGFPHDLNHLGSLYGRTNRHKHLEYINPIQYAGGDALHTMDIWEDHVGQFTRDPKSKWVYEHCQRPLLPIILKAKVTGSRVDKERARTAVEAMHAQQADIEWRAQAAAGFPINLGSPKQVGEWLFRVEKIK